MSLELHQPITISKVNIRKKGPADARLLMIDVKLSAVTSPEILAHFDPTLRHFLFVGDDGGPRMRNLKPIGWDGEMAHMELDIAGERFIGATLTKFKFEALPSGRVALSCVASIHPEARQTAILADLAGDEVEIEIRPEPQLDLQPRLITELQKTLKEDGASLTISGPDGQVLAQFGTDENTDFPPAIDGKQANQAGVYFPTEVLNWGNPKKNSVSIDLVELATGEWLSACAIRIGTSYSSSPLKAFRGERFASRLGALVPIRSKLFALAAKGLDSGLSKAEHQHFTDWLNGGFVAIPAPVKRVAAKPEIKFRHPDNDQLAWTGRGKPPAWAKALMDSGRALEAA